MTQAPDSPSDEVPETEARRWMRFRQDFAWLLGGALAYAVALAVAIALKPGDTVMPILGHSLYLTPIFGLPYVVATFRRPGRLRRLLYFSVLLTLVHIAANYCAWAQRVGGYDPWDPAHVLQRNLLAGGLGGAIGAVFSFTLLSALRLARPGRAVLPVMMVATLVLTALGAGCMALGLGTAGTVGSSPDDPARLILWYEIVHFPWQVAFAFFLAWILRRVPSAERPPEMPRSPPTA